MENLFFSLQFFWLVILFIGAFYGWILCSEFSLFFALGIGAAPQAFRSTAEEWSNAELRKARP